MKQSGPPKRRTPLAQGKGLAPGKALARKTPMPRAAAPTPKPQAIARTIKPTKRPRDTGASPSVKSWLWIRSGGRCERCGRDVSLPGAEWSRQHRLPRRMGGTRNPLVNALGNLALLCGSATTGCHNEVEKHRTKGLAGGWLVRGGTDPMAVPVTLYTGREVLLHPSEPRYLPVPTTG